MSDLNSLMDAWMGQVSLDEKKLDPVGKADADIDNDGDVDSSDEYLKNRRKAIGKSMKKGDKKDESYGKKKEDVDVDEACGKKHMKEEEKVECPKCEGKGCDHCDDKGYHMKEEKVEPTMEETAMSVSSERTVQSWSEFSEKYDELNFKGKKRPQDMPLGQSSIRDVKSNDHTKGSTPPEGMFDKESEKSKAFIKMHQKSDPEWENKEDEGHDDVSKAGRGVKSQSPNRMGRDNRKGDTKVINPITQKV